MSHDAAVQFVTVIAFVAVISVLVVIANIMENM